MKDSPQATELVEREPAPPDVEPSVDPDAVCWCCGGSTHRRHCKIVCLNCGFMRDCSDP
jgi:hypothetical protein